MNATKAIRKARDDTSQLYQMGSGWTYNTWSSKHKAWWMGNSAPYCQALSYRRSYLIATALEFGGFNENDALCIANENSMGIPWTEFVQDQLKTLTN